MLPNLRGIWWITPDALIDERSYQTALFQAMSSQKKSERVYVPTDQHAESIPFDVFWADKVGPHVLVWAILDRPYSMFAPGHSIPFKPNLALLPVIDPRKWHHQSALKHRSMPEVEIEASVQMLAQNQIHALESRINSLSYYDFPKVLVYLRNVQEPFPKSLLIGDDILNELRFLSYHVSELDNFAYDLADILNTI